MYIYIYIYIAKVLRKRVHMKYLDAEGYGSRSGCFHAGPAVIQLGM